MTDVHHIQIILARMVELLRLGGRNDWALALDSCHSEIEKDPVEATAKILSMYGGMGSLNDLILYQDGKVLPKENSEFDGLRSRLHDICHG